MKSVVFAHEGRRLSERLSEKYDLSHEEPNLSTVDQSEKYSILIWLSGLGITLGRD